MPQLLLELFCEEIPARMQAKAQADLERAVMDKLSEAGLMAEGVKAFSGPRRLCVVAEGLPVKSADVREERKGPKVGAPEKAIAGFLRGAGLDSIEQAEIQDDKKKGQFYVAVINKPGVETTQIIANMVPEIVRSFHWPKSMRWGSGELRWVRPLQRILCTFDGEVVPFEIDGIASSNVTQGHRIMGAGPFTVRRFEDYSDILKNKGRVIYDREERKDIIATEAKTLCDAQGLELVPDIGLLEEVAGLAEFPVVIMGDMDPKFLALPPEVITLSMRVHQKYFAVRDPKTGKLAPKFIVVANLEAEDGGKTIAAGNSKVLSARLSDAVFFYENDKAKKLETRFDSLGNIVFHEKLGTVKDKAERVAALAGELAPIVSAKAEDAIAAAKLAKCDLVAEMVFEFTELEGVMGRYYAMEEGQPQHIADTIRDHYKPKGPSDDVPTEPTAVAVALADKLDTLVGFWAIDEKPTGSKDPFALRRAALGVIRLILENDVRIGLQGAMLKSKAGDLVTKEATTSSTVKEAVDNAFETVGITDLLSFFEDRLKVYLRDKGMRHDLLDAVFSLGGDDLVLIVKRVEALASFLETEDGKNLVSGHKRATNILQKEEKKDGSAITGEIDKKLLSEAAELSLHEALNAATAKAEAALAEEDFAAAMSALSLLRAPVDTFFDDVIVNAEDNKVRVNRLKLLARIRDVTSQVADFSKIEG
ncbi:glycine--tRNA ligase subunit beta [Hirschia litorea]|uniref:Glycine--tRNA ligase beta subunit n=1 Tax=Hirschia litorea TaxID=1199156 RepID=A0ABW2IIY0_9PROT